MPSISSVGLLIGHVMNKLSNDKILTPFPYYYIPFNVNRTIRMT